MGERGEGRVCEGAQPAATPPRPEPVGAPRRGAPSAQAIGISSLGTPLSPCLIGHAPPPGSSREPMEAAQGPGPGGAGLEVADLR